MPVLKKLAVLTLGFALSVLSQSSNLMINRLQVTAEGNSTRISLSLSQPSNLYVKEDKQHRLLKIEAPEDTVWNIPSESKQALGDVEKYALFTNGEGIQVCMVSLHPRSVLESKGLKKSKKGYSYEIRLIRQEPEKPVLPPPPPPAPPTPVVVQPLIEITQSIDPDEAKTKVKLVELSQKGPNTCWLTIRSNTRQYFDFQSIPEEKNILVYLPKTDWSKTPLKNQQVPLIPSLTIDDDSANQSQIVLTAPRVIDVVDQFISPNQDGTFDFSLVIAPRKASAIEVQRLIQKKMEFKEQEQSKPSNVIQTSLTPPEVQISALPDQNLETREDEQLIPGNLSNAPLEMPSGLNLREPYEAGKAPTQQERVTEELADLQLQADEESRTQFLEQEKQTEDLEASPRAGGARRPSSPS